MTSPVGSIISIFDALSRRICAVHSGYRGLPGARLGGNAFTGAFYTMAKPHEKNLSTNGRNDTMTMNYIHSMRHVIYTRGSFTTRLNYIIIDLSF